jgi:hypothetical protein
MSNLCLHMNDAYYEKILNDSIGKMTALAASRDSIEIELIKLRELIHATANMLSDEKQRSQYLAVLNAAMEREGIRDASLTNAVRKVLQDARGKYLTVSDVRDHLKLYAFDFSEYASNPLASISTTLRRFKPQDVQTKDFEGVTAYRWIFRFPRIDTDENPLMHADRNVSSRTKKTGTLKDMK